MDKPPRTLTLSAEHASIEDILQIAAGTARVALSDSPPFLASLQKTVDTLESLLASNARIYGITTGFGASCENNIPPELSHQLAANLVAFHGCGTGTPFTDLQSAAITAVRLVSLAKGRSGVRPLVLQRLCDLLNLRLLPLIPAEGSVGASGDLTPLSYLAATLLGTREVSFQNKILPAAEALAAARLAPIDLRPRESLALMNGTSAMTGLACIAFDRSLRLARWAAALTAMASDVLLGNRSHFDPRIFLAKPHPGQLAAARWIAHDIEFSPNEPRHEHRLQDRYSVRCAPHIIGVLLDSLPFARQILEVEINSSNDNPLFDPDTGDVLHGGNFYGGHACMIMDLLKTNVANLADLADRQMALLCNPDLSNGLPADLVTPNAGNEVIHHGFKAMQISASALAAEALKLTMPASAFSRSTESHNQDKVSMGTIAARDCLRILDLTETVLAITQLALTQAVDLRTNTPAPGAAGSGRGVQGDPTSPIHLRSRQLHAAIRRHIPQNTADRRQDLDIITTLHLYHTHQLPLGTPDFPT